MVKRNRGRKCARRRGSKCAEQELADALAAEAKAHPLNAPTEIGAGTPGYEPLESDERWVEVDDPEEQKAWDDFQAETLSRINRYADAYAERLEAFLREGGPEAGEDSVKKWDASQPIDQRDRSSTAGGRLGHPARGRRIAPDAGWHDNGPAHAVAEVGQTRRMPMRSFFFMGRNSKNKSGVSWKIWRIARQGRDVTLSWGPAVIVRRIVVPAGTLQTKLVRFPSVDAARRYEADRVRRKLAKGYERGTRRR